MSVSISRAASRKLRDPPSTEHGRDVTFDHLRSDSPTEQRRAAADARVLHRGAVAVSDLTVIEEQEHRHSLARLANGNETRSAAARRCT